MSVLSFLCPLGPSGFSPPLTCGRWTGARGRFTPGPLQFPVGPVVAAADGFLVCFCDFWPEKQTCELWLLLFDRSVMVGDFES